MKTITKLPTNWPTDKLTRRKDWNGFIVIAHPDREPHISADGRTWEKVRVPTEEEVTDFVVHGNVVIFA